MGKINWGRVILGGLLAGVIINAGEFVLNEPILKEQWTAALRDLGKPAIGGSAIGVFIALGFLMGIVLLFIYAGIRPRFGAGPKTAICAGLIGWVLAYLNAAAGQAAIGLFPTNLLAIGTIWGLVELPLATVVGAWLYKEA